MKYWLIVLALYSSSFAANYTVKQDGSGNFSTIGLCVAAMADGDTCTIYDTSVGHTGTTYSENIAITNASGVGLKTLTVNGDDLIYTLPFTSVGSNVSINGGATPKPCTGSWEGCTPTGWHIQNTNSPASAACVPITTNSTNVHFSNLNLYACGSNAMIQTTSASFVYITGVKFSYPCGTHSAPNACRPIQAYGDHWLVDNVDISHSRGIDRKGSYGMFRVYAHDFTGTDFSGVYPIYYPLDDPLRPGDPVHDCSPQLSATVDISGNTITWKSGQTFGQEYPGAFVTVGASATRYYITAVTSSTVMVVDGSPPNNTGLALHGGVGSACHADVISSEPNTGTTQFNFVEKLLALRMLGKDTKGILAQGDVCGGKCDVFTVRFSTFGHFGSGGLVGDNNGANATVNTNGTAVTRSSPSSSTSAFTSQMVGGTYVINGVGYTVQSVTDANNMTLTTSAGVQTGVAAGIIGFTNIKAYNNNYIDILNYLTNYNASGAGSGATFTWFSYNGSNINNLYYIDNSISGLNAYYASSSNPVSSTLTGAPSGYRNFFASNNGAWVTGSSKTLYGHTYQTGRFCAVSNANCTATTGSDPNNVVLDPLFKDYPNNDFHLSNGSPYLGTGTNPGTNLTTVISGCNSKALTLDETAFFQDGLGLAGVSADVLSVTSRTNKCSITSIVGKVVNCVETVTCTNGDPVWPYSIGDGTVVFGSGTQMYSGASGPAQVAPYTLTATVSGTATGYISGTDSMSCGSGGRVTCTESHNAGDSITYTQNTLTGQFITWGGTLAQAFGCTTASTCVVNPYPASDGSITAQFSLQPTATLSSNIANCNVLQNSCTPTYTVTTTNLSTGGSSWSLKDAFGNVITDTSSGLPVSCTYGTSSDFCSGTPTGTFTIHASITGASFAIVQQSATVWYAGGGFPLASSTPVYIGLYGGRTAGTPAAVIK